MSVLVKICGLTTPEAVAAVADAGADAAGFVFAPSVRQVSVDEARSLAEPLPAEILRVAVFRHPAPADVREVIDGFRPDVVQTDAADFEGLDIPSSVTCMPVFRHGEAVPADPGAERILFEGPVSGAGEVTDWDAAARLARRLSVVLAGGLSPDNVADAIRRVNPAGVDVSSGVESAPGVKDPAAIHRFVAAARRAAAQTVEVAGHGNG